ncbi:MAG: ATP-binding protein [Actinomycetales bacterium]|nr:ATP-binding protein [Actinomycetales bacterium]
MIPRRVEGYLREKLQQFPAVALLGPRQVGKTTLALDIASGHPEAIYLDLERPADLRRLDDADAFLRSQAGRLIVLDEVHRVPGLFETLRGVIDESRRAGFRTGQFLLLGSASPNLIGMASESLAGRMAYVDLNPIDALEARDHFDGGGHLLTPDTVWLRGGFPDSLLAGDDHESLRWREAFIRSFLDRDVPMFAPRLPGETVHRLWQMLAHGSTGPLNAGRLGASLGISGPTVSRYVDLLVDLGMVRRLTPWLDNLGKRLTRMPKVYLRDTGLLHALLGIGSMHELLGHPVAGPSFETLAIETVISLTENGPWQPAFYRTADGAEIDLVLVKGGQPEIAIEVKRSTAPVPSAGFYRAARDLGISDTFVLYPGQDRFPLKGGAVAIPILDSEAILVGR